MDEAGSGPRSERAATISSAGRICGCGFADVSLSSVGVEKMRTAKPLVGHQQGTSRLLT